MTAVLGGIVGFAALLFVIAPFFEAPRICKCGSVAARKDIYCGQCGKQL